MQSTVAIATCVVCLLGADLTPAATIYGVGSGGVMLIDTDARTVTPLFDTPGGGGVWIGATDGDQRDTIFAVRDKDDGSLYRIDVVARTVTEVGAMGAEIRELAYDEETGTLYASDYETLYTIDRATGAATAVGEHRGSGGVWAMDYDASTDRVVWVQTHGWAYAFDTATGAARPVMELRRHAITDIWYDAEAVEMVAVTILPQSVLRLNLATRETAVLFEHDPPIYGLGRPGRGLSPIEATSWGRIKATFR